VVGTGSIGREIARVFHAIGMRVSGAARSRRPGDDDFAQIHPSRHLARIFGDDDFVVLAAPLTTETDEALEFVAVS
jgi:phosphoglycerate dehydrogenase-like enzyme